MPSTSGKCGEFINAEGLEHSIVIQMRQLSESVLAKSV